MPIKVWLWRYLRCYEEAVEAYGQAIGVDPTNASLYNNMGHLLKFLGRQTEAQQAYAMAQQLHSTNQS